MLKKYFLIVFYIIYISFSVFSQERDTLTFINSLPCITGTPGLILTPTARIGLDQDVTISLNKMSSKYAFVLKGYDEYIGSFSVNFLPFLQMTATIIRNTDTRETSHYGIGDRSFKIRLKLLSEQRIVPDITIGAHDLFSQDTKYSSAVYAVASKNIKGENNVDWGLHCGYAFDTKLDVKIDEKIEAYRPYLIGTFYGVSMTYKKRISFKIEYDTDKINTGVNVALFNRLGLSANLVGMDGFCFGISYTVSPRNWIRKKQYNPKPPKQKISKAIAG